MIFQKEKTLKKIKRKCCEVLLAALLTVGFTVPVFADPPEPETEEITEIVMEEITEEDDSFFALDKTVSGEVAVEEVIEVEENENRGDSVSDEVSVFGAASGSIGDLWNEKWEILVGNPASSMGLTGDGTEASPYRVGTINQLMWISGQIAMGTSGYDEASYILTTNLDYSGAQSIYGFWHPIGWAANQSGLLSGTVNSFKGHFDGNGYTVSGIEILDRTGLALTNVGLFGIIEGGVVENLTVKAGTVNGYDYAGILAGQILGASEIHNVRVEGAANVGISVTKAATGAHVGGIAGSVNGDALTAEEAAVIENATAYNVTLNSTGGTSVVGGICGSSANAYIVDSYVLANGTHGIQGNGYVGGIVGCMSEVEIFNSYIAGVIGGNGSVAAGGVCGEFRSGSIYLVQMNGSIGKTNQGTSHEGTIIGTRAGATRWVYGTNDDDNAGYLFYNSDLRGNALSGSGLTGDASGVTKSAETGFWTDNQTKYTLMEGSNPVPCESDQYFYEELERGVRHIITQRLDREFSVEDYADGLRFSIDHYAAGTNGAPVRGHLLTIPMVNSQNSVDLDVATLTATAGDGSLYYKVMDMNSCAAVAPGTVVKVLSAPKNIPSENRYFQRVVDETVPEMVKRPTYTVTDRDGNTGIYPMDYQTGGSYTFLMPDSDSEINIYYEKVLSAIVTSPVKTTIRIRQTRSGNRKTPLVTWDIVNENGMALCEQVSVSCPSKGADYSWQFLENSQVTPVPVDIIFNSVSTDNRVMWSVDDDTLLNKEGTAAGYTTEHAYIRPEVTIANSWLSGILADETKKQANNNYSTRMSDTVYSKTAVLSALTDPDHSIDNRPVYAHCDVTFTFQIIDRTTLLTEGVTLDKESLVFDITRHLTGSRRLPASFYTITPQKDLMAEITPPDADIRSVTWDLTGAAATSLTQEASGEYDHDNTVKLIFDGKDLSGLPDWAASIAAADDAKKTAGATDAEKNAKLSGAGSKKAVLSVTATDRELDVWKDTCDITVNFQTIDETPDVTDVSFDQNPLTLTVTRTLTGQRNNPTETFTVSAPQTVTASLIPSGCAFTEDVSWMLDSALSDTITSTAVGTHKSQNTVSLKFSAADPAARPAWITAIIHADDAEWAKAKNSFVRKGSGTKSGKLTLTTHDVTVVNGAFAKDVPVTVNFVTDDQTRVYQSSSSAGGGGGGGGAISGGGTSVGSGLIKTATGLPSYVISGTWVQSADGTWRFSSGRTYTAEWAAVYNPYAVDPQAAFDWFRFDENSVMVTGWFTDPADGNNYYLWPVSDNTLGHMTVGCQVIDGIWYYFNEKSDGTRGKLMRSANVTASDGKMIATDASGRIISVNGAAGNIDLLTPTPNTTESLRASGVIAH